MKRNFLGGRTPTTLSQANQDVLTWCQTTAGQRTHGTTKHIPLVQFRTTEQPALQALPTSPYDLAAWKGATVARDCYVVFNQAFYSVPFRLVGQAVQIRGGAADVRIYTADWQLVATHQRATTAGERLTHLDHLPPTHRPGLLLGREMALDRATMIGGATQQVVRSLLADSVVDRLRTVGRILQLAERVGAVRLEAACARAIRYDAVSHQAIKAILAQGLDQEPPPAPLPPPAQTYVRDAQDLLGHLFDGVAWS